MAICSDELRDDQILYVQPFDGMPVERVMEITGGRRVVVTADLKAPLPAVSTRPGT